MGFICKNLLSLYAILHTSTVKFSILWLAVVTGKNIEAHKIVFISVSDKGLNPSPVFPCVHDHFLQMN